MNHKKIQRIMRKYDVVTKVKKKPIQSHHAERLEHRVFPNILDRAFDQTVPFRVFCTDITYIPFRGPLRISIVKDIASGEVVAWNLSDGLEETLVLDTMRNMPRVSDDAMIHSDQRFHHTNPQYMAAVEAWGWRNPCPARDAVSTMRPSSHSSDT